MENNKIGYIVGIIVIGLLIIGGLIWYSSSDNDDSDSTENQTTTQPVESTEVEEEAPAQDIVALASETESLSTLVTAVQAAELVETLQSDGPFTVLAPTNAAFEALPEGTLEDLLKPANKEQLSGILTYHVIAGEVMSSDLTDGQVVETVNGKNLTVEIVDEGVYFVDGNGGKAKVETADVEASNGVVHIINAVLLPQK